MTSTTIAAGQRLFSPPQVASAADQHPVTVWRHIKRGDLPVVRIGRLYFVSEPDVAAYIAHCRAARRARRRVAR